MMNCCFVLLLPAWGINAGAQAREDAKRVAVKGDAVEQNIDQKLDRTWNRTLTGTRNRK